MPLGKYMKEVISSLQTYKKSPRIIRVETQHRTHSTVDEWVKVDRLGKTYRLWVGRSTYKIHSEGGKVVDALRNRRTWVLQSRREPNNFFVYMQNDPEGWVQVMHYNVNEHPYWKDRRSKPDKLYPVEEIMVTPDKPFPSEYSGAEDRILGEDWWTYSAIRNTKKLFRESKYWDSVGNIEKP